jgi:hypothetical protein
MFYGDIALTDLEITVCFPQNVILIRKPLPSIEEIEDGRYYESC